MVVLLTTKNLRQKLTINSKDDGYRWRVVSATETKLVKITEQDKQNVISQRHSRFRIEEAEKAEKAKQAEQIASSLAKDACDVEDDGKRWVIHTGFDSVMVMGISNVLSYRDIKFGTQWANHKKGQAELMKVKDMGAGMKALQWVLT